MLSKTSPSASQSTYDKTPLLKGDGSNLVHFKKDFWRKVVQEGRPEVANNVIFGALPKTEASSKDYDFCVTSYRKVIKEKNRTVPPRGHEDLEVEPQHYVDGYSGRYKLDYIYEVVTTTDEEGEVYETMVETPPQIDPEEKYGWFPGDSHCGPRHSVKVSDNQKARLASSSFWSEMGVVAATLVGKLEASMRYS